MQCPSPVNIKDPRGTSNAQRLSVPCNKCPICLQNRRADWSFRLTEELRTSKTGYFITLTLDDDNLIYNIETRQPELYKRHITLFNKRLRKQITLYEGNVSRQIKQPLEPLKIKYYTVGEYGTKTHRPHYHGIYFNVPLKIIEKLHKIWKLGNVHYGYCTPASIHYTCKYVINNFEHKDDRQKPFAVMSKGLGKKYIQRNDAWHVHNLAPYVIKDGYKQRMPRYYKTEIFNEDERAKIAEINRDLDTKNFINDYDKAFNKLRVQYIENQFRIIKNQSKSK
ncbi:replication initiator protein [Microviridae sp.]|nr:replication initiator protein [Microviridae sp.]